jgi:hypothetical protein
MTNPIVYTYRWAANIHWGTYYSPEIGVHTCVSASLYDLICETGKAGPKRGQTILVFDEALDKFVEIPQLTVEAAFDSVQQAFPDRSFGPEYVAAEPEQVSSYKDQHGGLHETRDAAIAANFEQDLMTLIKAYCEREIEQGVDPDKLVPLQFRRFIKDMAKRDPDVLRILVGDRDAT